MLWAAIRSKRQNGRGGTNSGGKHLQHAPSYQTGGVFQQGKTPGILGQQKILGRESSRAEMWGGGHSQLEWPLGKLLKPSLRMLMSVCVQIETVVRP